MESTTDSRTSKERLQSPKRYFLDAPKEQPGTCFVKNDDYVLALDEIESLHARLDALMLEYCPNEMTAPQIQRWAANQKQVRS